MPAKKSVTHIIELTEAHLRLIAEFVEVTHRAICGQYKPLFDLIQEKTGAKLDYDDKLALENLLLSKLQPELEPNASYGGDFDKLGYQTYRDILEFFCKDLPDSGLNVYRHPIEQIADEPKLKIYKIVMSK